MLGFPPKSQLRPSGKLGDDLLCTPCTSSVSGFLSPPQGTSFPISWLLIPNPSQALSCPYQKSAPKDGTHASTGVPKPCFSIHLCSCHYLKLMFICSGLSYVTPTLLTDSDATPPIKGNPPRRRCSVNICWRYQHYGFLASLSPLTPGPATVIYFPAQELKNPSVVSDF